MENKENVKSELYEKLKSSPLSNSNASPEEAAIWLDVEGLNNVKSIIKIFNEIEAHYHMRSDMTTGSARNWLNFMRIARAYGAGIASSMISPSSVPPIGQFYSDVILKNLFILMFQANMLDDIATDKQLKAFAYKMMTKHKRTDPRSQYDTLSIDKFEIWAELYDRICEKLTEK